MVPNQCPLSEVRASASARPAGELRKAVGTGKNMMPISIVVPERCDASGSGTSDRRYWRERPRDHDTGRIKTHGSTRIGSLRKTYGEHFAKGRRGHVEDLAGR